MSDPNVVTRTLAGKVDLRRLPDLKATRGNEGRGKRGIRVYSAGALLRASRLLIAFMLVAAPVALLPVWPAARQGGAPVVSPDRIEDVPSLMADVDAFPELDNFSWRAFIALNWPSLTDPAHRGVPDRAKTLGDPGPRVWETFKARYELFQVGPDGRLIAPQPWATYDAANPCGADVNGRAKTLATFDPFMDFNQFASLPGVATNPLVAQNRTYTRYETRLNEPEYLALALSGWSQGQNLPDQDHPARLPAGSIAVKAAWRLLTAADTLAVRARYYVVENADVVDVAKTLAARRVVCSKSDVALVGLHIVIRTPRRPQGLWSTFEHVDNVPPAGAGKTREPDARDAGVPYSYFNASKPRLGLWPQFGSPDTFPVSRDHPPKIDPDPMQVVRRHPIHASTMAMNRAYWALPGIKGTVWEHYMLVANQWPTRAHPIDPHNDGIYFPEGRKENLVNTTIETYFQDPPSSCMACHQGFNARGRDFVGMLGSFR
ncbi:MAG TPA: hypothetical protein VKA60_08230 [Blastocatellia bacterium]|nr:hypothetical protein [Blastocatellia bacterium]